MANRAVALYQSMKVQGKWTMRKAPQRKMKLTAGQYFVSWYEGSRKRMAPVGPEPDVALTSLRKKKAELNFVAAGGQLSEHQHKRDCETIRSAVEAYLDDCRARQGKSGYGMAKTTVDAYNPTPAVGKDEIARNLAHAVLLQSGHKCGRERNLATVLCLSRPLPLQPEPPIGLRAYMKHIFVKQQVPNLTEGDFALTRH